VHPIVSAARATITARLTFRLSADNESPALPAGAGKLAVDESALLKLLNRWLEEAEKAGREKWMLLPDYKTGVTLGWTPLLVVLRSKHQCRPRPQHCTHPACQVARSEAPGTREFARIGKAPMSSTGREIVPPIERSVR
jgi:hypothetical protein